MSKITTGKTGKNEMREVVRKTLQVLIMGLWRCGVVGKSLAVENAKEYEMFGSMCERQVILLSQHN